MIKILLLDDSISFLENVSGHLQRYNYQVKCCRTPEEAEAALKMDAFSVYIIDGDLGDGIFTADGLSGKFYLSLPETEKTKVIRFSAEPRRIPEELAGFAALSKLDGIEQLVEIIAIVVSA